MDVTFKSRNHEYLYGDIKLISVSKLIEQYHEPFNEKMIAAIVARKKGLPIKAILSDWKRARDDGTEVHKLCEELLTNKELYNINDKYRPYVENAFKFLTSFTKDEINMITPEMLLYSIDDGVAGTSDIVLINHKKKYICVYDWKKVDKFDMLSYNNKTMHMPINHLVDTKYNKYSLQLSIYAYMLQLKYPEYVIQEIAFIQLTNETYRKYNTPYLKTDVINLLKHYNGDKKCGKQVLL